MTHTMRYARTIVLGAFALAVPAMVRAQLVTDTHVRLNVPAGFETEQYLRALQVEGIAPMYPWSIRAFGVDELKRIVPSADSAHPWAARLRAPEQRRFDAYLIAPQVQAFYNSTMPYGSNDGAIWAGRGLTTDIQFGFGASAGPVSLIIAPEAFRAENQGFELLDNGQTGRLAYANAYWPSIIDYPQRFGNHAYQRLTLGQSTLRVAAGPVAMGVSTANEYWGPAVFNPILLGNNASGFPHVFAGTSKPLDLWIAKVHGRVIWGRLDQTDYTRLTDSNTTRRLGSGVVGIIEPRGVPGLELGAARFYHQFWPASGLRWEDIRRVFALHQFAASKENSAGVEKANQIAEVFFRWNFPGAGLEAYGEFGREDYNNDIYDVLTEPDHISAYTVGVQRTLRRSSDRLIVLKGEIMNSRITRLENLRGQTPFYVHSPVAQGHTELGQVLGGPAGFGGGGTNVAVDIYEPKGRWTFGASRQMANQTRAAGQSVFYGLNAERLWFRRYADIRVAVTQALFVNRLPGQDVGNLNLQLGTLLHW